MIWINSFSTASALPAQLPSDSPLHIGPSVSQSHLTSGPPVTCCTDCCVACLQEQVEYLDDSEVDFSSDDDEEDMEDFEGDNDVRLAAGQSQLGKRPAGMHSVHSNRTCLFLIGESQSLIHAHVDRVERVSHSCMHTWTESDCTHLPTCMYYCVGGE